MHASIMRIHVKVGQKCPMYIHNDFCMDARVMHINMHAYFFILQQFLSRTEFGGGEEN